MATQLLFYESAVPVSATRHGMRVAQTEDALEGPLSFKEKRAPQWKAR